MKRFPTALLLLACCGLADAAYTPWPKQAVQSFSRIPVLSEGRVKPLQTVAYYTLLELQGRTTLKTRIAGGSVKLSASEWLMDAIFRPDLSKDYPIFLIDDTSAVRSLDLVISGKRKRDRFSYSELLPVRAKLANLASTYAQKKAREEKLTALEEQVLILGGKVNDYEMLVASLSPAQPNRLINTSMLPPDMAQLAAKMRLSEFLGMAPKLPVEAIEAMMQRDREQMTEDERQVLTAMMLVYFFHKTGTLLTLFPPPDPQRAEWVSLGELVGDAIGKEKTERAWELERLALVEKVAQSTGDPSAFSNNMEALRSRIQSDASARKEAGQIETELRLYNGKYLDNAKAWFIAAFLFVILMWLGPMTTPGKVFTVLAIWCGVFGFISLVAGMLLRSQIRGWAPITNLYETFLFISASAFVFGLLFERSNRQRIALSAGIFVPTLCLILSGQFLLISPEDTLPPLVAVLRSNFWLTTHVITVTLGYSAGLLAAVIASIWIVARFFRIAESRRDVYRDATKMTYGIILFSLLFSLVGTVLGGIWANYSWGRFWGWDPKENGALMIVLWTLVILHARLGGYIRDIGLHVMAVLQGVIISFSWFGVNAMGVGLHSYGFIAGIWTALGIAWGVMAVIIAMAAGLKFRESQSAPHPGPAGELPRRRANAI
ncbi:MAG: ABC-type transport system involved in cytochrome c biogenesis, permease component [Verrucomicrobia bacterium]|jgi:ABC-type transport system involved in cytochrome c biogenesis permease subunit|nr:MAG: ABC-type transport system involved in cytochrome c biogenesis, permease component [Verrucomicrobiota bacterium]